MNLWTWLRAEWDRVAGFGLVLLGAVLLYLGYRGVRTSPFLAEELAYIASGGLGGLFCMGFGVGLLLSADLHDEWYKLDRIESAIRGEPLPESTTVLDLMAEEAEERRGRNKVTAAVVVDRIPRRSGSMTLAMDWRATHRARAVGVLALLLLLPLAVSTAGWRRASRTPDLHVASQGLALAAAGTVVALTVIAGYTFWLRARVVRREGRVFREYLLAHGLAVLRHSESETVEETVLRNGSVLVAAGLRRYHREGCPALAGLEVSTVDRAALGAGATPCGICGA
jgi:hypothetical protein